MLCIVSYPRSGSTALQKIVESCDESYIANESNGAILNICDFVIKSEALASPLLYDNLGQLQIFGMRGFNDINFNFILNECRKIFIDGLLNINKNIKVAGWKENDISPIVYGEEKCFRYIDTIKKIFPNIVFIFNTRNAIDVSKSGPWKRKQNAVEEINRWNYFLETAYAKNNNNSIIVSHDKWKKDFYYLENNFKKININISSKKCKQSYENQLNHLKMW